MKTVQTSEYEFSHGHTPRGRGSWAFAPYNQQTGRFDEAPDRVVWKNGTYTEAKRALPAGDWKVLP